MCLWLVQVEPGVQKLYDYIRERGTILGIRVNHFTEAIIAIRLPLGAV